MATEEELNIVIRTVADTRGAQQVSEALQHSQQSAGQLQQQLSAQQQFANQVLRQSMAQVPQTLEAFRTQARAVEAQIGARPTLRPEDLGIGAIQQVQQAHAATANAAAATVRNQAAAVAGAAATTTAATREFNPGDCGGRIEPRSSGRCLYRRRRGAVGVLDCGPIGARRHCQHHR